jgi:superfamily I DNA/RNA helicase
VAMTRARKWVTMMVPRMQVTRTGQTVLAMVSRFVEEAEDGGAVWEGRGVCDVAVEQTVQA